MGNNQSARKISEQDRAILDMKNQRDKLRQYQKRITLITDREKAIAKECLAQGNKEQALLALRRKKYQESRLAQTDSQLEQLEKLTTSVDFALIQKDVLYGLEQGTRVLQQIHKEMGGLEAVEKLMGETQEARAYQQEISEALAGQMSNEDEDEVEDELERMQKEANVMPDVATQRLTQDANLSAQDANPTVQDDSDEYRTMPDVPTSMTSQDPEWLRKQKERAKARKVALHA